MGPIWGRQDPGGPHVGLMNLLFRTAYKSHSRSMTTKQSKCGFWYWYTAYKTYFWFLPVLGINLSIIDNRFSGCRIPNYLNLHPVSRLLGSVRSCYHYRFWNEAILGSCRFRALLYLQIEISVTRSFRDKICFAAQRSITSRTIDAWMCQLIVSTPGLCDDSVFIRRYISLRHTLIGDCNCDAKRTGPRINIRSVFSGIGFFLWR